MGFGDFWPEVSLNLVAQERFSITFFPVMNPFEVGRVTFVESQRSRVL